MEVIASDKQSPTPPWQMYRAMVGVALVCGLLIVSVYMATLEVIAANRAALLQRAIFRVLPGTVTYQSVDLDPTVYAGFSANQQLVGIAVPAQGMGYQDVIRILYGYDPDRQQIVGMQVLQSKETPGLGDKIETDAHFVENFAALSVAVAADGLTLAHPLELVKPGAKTTAWQIDAISGATISSTAIAKMLGASSASLVPQLYRQRGNFTAPVEVVGSGDDE
jgi:electron transport complex protein RnfG